MPTLRTIAQHAGVSTSTVSLVVNGSSSVSHQTRQRVQKVVEELGYRPRPVGRPSNRSDQWHSGIVYARRVMEGGRICQLSREWIDGIRKGFNEGGSEVNLFAGLDHVENDVLFQQVLEDGELDALVLVGVLPEDGYLQHAMTAGIPVVAMNRRPREAEFSCVRMDSYGAGFQVAKHFAELGHRRVALITGPDPVGYPPERTAGAQEGLVTHGLEEAGLIMLSPLAPQQEVAAACARVLKEKATAVYIMSDSIAARCAEQWLAGGISLPQDLSVVGFDGTADRLSNGQQLTSIGYDRQAMGRAAADIALRMLEGRSTCCSLQAIFATQWEAGDTSGSAPPAGMA